MSIGSWIIVSLAAAGFLAFAAGMLAFRRWRNARLAALEAGSLIAPTSRGPVEYASIGQGPVVLYFHGSIGGYDQGVVAGHFLNKEASAAEFTLLAPSRPGYLRTPLETGRTPEEQADALAALLDHLGIEKVAAIGASGGGPFALQFALRHPHRLSALVMFCAIARRMPPRPRSGMLKRIFSSRIGPLLLDLLSAFLQLLLQFRTERFARRLFRGTTTQTVTTAEIHNAAAAMMRHPEEIHIFKGIVSGMLPLSARIAGIRNDEEQIALLADAPLEQIDVPTQVIHGREDSVVAFIHPETVAAKIAGAEVHPIERWGHFIWVGEHRQQMRSAIVDFLRKHAFGRMKDEG
jgi:pimeloyl-ACP methyl ester carboxylesterase